ncbi:MAG: hypothetical protein IT371_21645 [Deltaproteobacteria bacterium]|nr:hypothetical protein [Deltaproteobacteria bacterium]
MLAGAIGLVGLTAPPLRASAAPSVAPSPSATPAPELKRVPPILDPAFRHQKRYQLELSPHGGSLLGRTLGSSFLVGVRAHLHLSPWLALGASYDYSRIPSSAAFEVLPTVREVHLLLGEASISNDLAMRVGRRLVALDLFLTVGLGSMNLAQAWKLAGLVGGGVKFYVGLPWLAVRIDLLTVIHPTPVSRVSSRIDADIALTGGVSFFLPARRSAYE